MNTVLNKVLNRVGNLLLLFLGTGCLGMLMENTFSLVLPKQTWGWLALLCLFLWVSTGFRRGVLLGLPLCAATLYGLFRYCTADAAAEFSSLADRVISTYASHFGGYSAVSSAGQPEGHMTALLVFLFLVAAFLSVSLTSESFRVSLSRLFSLPFFAACIAVNGTPPVLPVVGMLLFWLGLSLSGDSFRSDDAGGTALILGLVPCVLVLSVLLLFFGPETYRYDERDISLSQQFDRLSHYLSARFESTGSSQGSTSEGTSEQGQTSLRDFFRGSTADSATAQDALAPAVWEKSSELLDLSGQPDSSALNRVAFTVNCDSSGTVYFRELSYGDYTGTAWTAAVDNPRASALDFAAQAVASSQQAELRSFTVTTPVKYDVLLLPYFTLSGHSGDLSVPSEGLRSYSGSFYRSTSALTGSLAEEASVREEERQYSQYAYNYYTRLPDSTAQALRKLCREQGLYADSGDIIEAVSSYVRRMGVYDLSMQAYSTDDYALYFLTESHRGFCIHYATAAVALYRSLGIPARICTGYMVNTVPGRDIRVTGENAHAWAEVYIDGTGWIPVEVTASEGDASEFPEAGTGADGSPASLEQPSLPDESEAPAASGDSDGEPDRPHPEEGGASADDASGPHPGAENTGRKSVPEALRVLLLLTGIPAALILLIYGRYRILRALLLRQFRKADCNGKAILLYRQACRAESFGAQMPEELHMLAEKAAFSQHTLSVDEADTCYKSFETMNRNVYASLSRWKRFFYRWFRGLI